MYIFDLGKTTHRKTMLAISVGALLAVSNTAMSAEEELEAKKVERIQVTGSRIKRTDMESATPVTVITAAEIQAAGVVDIAGLLQQSTFANGGSTVNRANNSWGNHSNTGLRGLGAHRTLVLVNGRRIANSSTAGGTSVNLNMIPLEAIERVEILRDGASAIYGADAMGGVQNFILKQGYEGLGFKASKSDTSRGGMGSFNSSLTFGIATDKAQLTMAYEHMNDEGLLGGERPHLDANNFGAENDFWRRHSSWGPHGSYQTIDEDGNRSEWKPGADCPTDMIVDYPWGTGGQKCAYDHSFGKADLPQRTKDSLFSSLNYNISDELNFYAQSIVLRDRSSTAANSVWVDGNLPAGHVYNPTTATDNEQEIYWTGRLEGAAGRVFDYETNMTDFNAGFDWSTDAGDLNINFSYSREKGNYTLKHDVFKEKFQAAIAEGNYDPFTPGGGPNATKEVLDTFRHTGTKEMLSDTTGVSVSWSALSGFELPGGEIGYAIGAEYREYNVSNTQDAQSAAESLGNGDLIVAWGSETEGERDFQAMFAEFDFPITDSWSMLLATRHDKWSMPDVGQTSTSVASRYELTDDIVLRASYGQGFRVGDIDDLVSTDSIGFVYVEDCNTCEDINIPLYTQANSNLKPETSEQVSVGAVWNITDDTSLAVDFWDIQINDEITSISAQQVVDLDHLGLLGNYDNSRIYVVRDPNEIDVDSGRHKLRGIASGMLNMDGVKTNGIDISFQHFHDLGELGNLRFTVDGTYVDSYQFKSDPLSDYVEEIGLEDRPKLRMNSSITYNYEDFGARLVARHIGDTHLEDGNTMAGKLSRIAAGEDDVEIDDPVASITEFDMLLTYDAGDYGKFDLGVYNLADKLPRVEDTTRGYNVSLHNIKGRSYRLTYRKEF